MNLRRAGCGAILTALLGALSCGGVADATPSALAPDAGRGNDGDGPEVGIIDAPEERVVSSLDASDARSEPGVGSVDADSDATISCPPAAKLCGSLCVSIEDPVHGCAGESCSPCSLPNANATCEQGSCSVGACDSEFGDCDADAANGCETALSNDPDHCGACGTACTVINGEPKCEAGLCAVLSCNAPWADCDLVLLTGCEMNTDWSESNCGGCGTVCALAHAVNTCTGGVCVIGSCVAPFADCNGHAADGCETDTSNDPTNCGGCGVVCSSTNGTPACESSLCDIVCNKGFASCDGSLANGCETNLHTLTDCGGCGVPCDLPHAVGTCANGSCALASCVDEADPWAGIRWGNCDGIDANGCETELWTCTQHCGGCGNACATLWPYPGSYCNGGYCGACENGQANCDLEGCGNTPFHCATWPATDPTNCGFCGNVCPPGTACSSGQCQ